MLLRMIYNGNYLIWSYEMVLRHVVHIHCSQYEERNKQLNSSISFNSFI